MIITKITVFFDKLKRVWSKVLRFLIAMFSCGDSCGCCGTDHSDSQEGHQKKSDKEEVKPEKVIKDAE